jgi:hypothetical protein
VPIKYGWYACTPCAPDFSDVCYLLLDVTPALARLVSRAQDQVVALTRDLGEHVQAVELHGACESLVLVDTGDEDLRDMFPEVPDDEWRRLDDGGWAYLGELTSDDVQEAVDSAGNATSSAWDGGLGILCVYRDDAYVQIQSRHNTQEIESLALPLGDGMRSCVRETAVGFDVEQHVSRLLHLSTGHIPQEDRDLLEADERYHASRGRISPLLAIPYPEGAVVPCIGIDDDAAEFDEEVLDHGFSEFMLGCLRLARSKGCDMIRFDAAGPLLPEEVLAHAE